MTTTMPLPVGSRLPGVAQSASWVFWPIPFMEHMRRRYGGTFTLRLAGLPPIVVLSDPDVVKEVFTGDPEVFHAGRANIVLRPILGESSLLLLDGERHMVERRLMMPAFHGERMQTYGRVMRESADRIIDGWPVGEAFSFHTSMQEVTLDVIMRTVFGVDDGRRKEELRRALVRVLAYGDQPGLLLLIGPDGELRAKGLHERLGRLSPWAGFKGAIEDVDATLLREIEERRARSGAAGEDVLSLLLSAKDEEGRSLDDRSLVHEMKTLLVAGHETTATALTWTLLELLQNPSVQGQLRSELGAESRTDPPYLDAVIRESLRLHPIVPMVARQLQAEARVGGRLYPKGTVLAPNIYLTQRNPSVWPDPERFDPARFLGSKANPYEFFPFGGGVRRCIGLAFALFEMRIVLRQIVTRARLRLAPGYRPGLVRRGITFAVKQGLPVILDGRGLTEADRRS